MQRDPADIPAYDLAYLGLQSKLAQYWKHSRGLITVSAFNGVMFYVTLDSCWLRTLLPFFGLSISIFWALINCPPPKYPYFEAMKIADELGLQWSWLRVVLSVTVNVVLGGTLAIIWLACIQKYVVARSLSSWEAFASFALGVLLFGSLIRVYLRAFKAESSLLLECDHLLREVGLRSRSKGRVYEIVCSECRQFYHTPEPLFTRGMCKQCYAHRRFLAEWWLGVSAFGILVWQFGLRDLTIQVVQETWLRWIVWSALFIVSSALWWPLVSGRWSVLFFWPKNRLSDSNSALGPVPPPRLIVGSEESDRPH